MKVRWPPLALQIMLRSSFFFFFYLPSLLTVLYLSFTEFSISDLTLLGLSQFCGCFFARVDILLLEVLDWIEHGCMSLCFYNFSSINCLNGKLWPQFDRAGCDINCVLVCLLPVRMTQIPWLIFIKINDFTTRGTTNSTQHACAVTLLSTLYYFCLLCSCFYQSLNPG